MRRRTIVIAAVLAFTAAAASADMIEVRGKGVQSGTIVSEDAEKIVFKDSWGAVSAYRRADILFLERTGEGPAAPSAAEPVKKKIALPDTRVARRWAEDAYRRVSEGDIAPPDLSALESVSTAVSAAMRSVSDFFVGDTARVHAVAVSAWKDLTRFRDFSAGKEFAGWLGTLLFLSASLGAIYFGASLLWYAFEEGFVWGVALAGTTLFWLEPFLGSSAALAALPSAAAAAFFLVTHWEAVRKPFVKHVLALDVALAGYWLIRIAS